MSVKCIDNFLKPQVFKQIEDVFLSDHFSWFFNEYKVYGDKEYFDNFQLTHILYKEGFATILHPGLENFSQTNYRIEFKSNAEINVYELNLPAKATEVNLSRNTSYIENLRLDDSAFNADEDFVYITDINLHDKDFNVIKKHIQQINDNQIKMIYKLITQSIIEADENSLTKYMKENLKGV